MEDSYSDGISAYVDALLDGAEVDPRLNKHLNECSDCWEVAVDLLDLLDKDQKGELVKPPVEPNFDFSYLGAKYY